MSRRTPPSDAAARSPSTRRSASPLVGRTSELQTLTGALSAADEGHGQTIFVVGESGIGKTHLVNALSEHATTRGFTVAIGRAYPVETGVPYAVFSDALLPLIRGLEPSVLTLLTRGGTAELAQLFPALDGAQRGTLTARGDPSELKARLLWNFTQFLARLAAKRPLLVVLEILQWADSASLEMLHFVARQIGGDRVLVIGTHNDPDHRVNAGLRVTEQSLRNLGIGARLRLQPLTVDETIELLEKRFGADAERTRHFAERLQHWTGGNPFFIDETIKALIERGQMRESNGQWTGW